MMMMTMMISVELEGVTQRQTESAGDCVLEKSSPAATAAAVHLVYFFGCCHC